MGAGSTTESLSTGQGLILGFSTGFAQLRADPPLGVGRGRVSERSRALPFKLWDPRDG